MAATSPLFHFRTTSPILCSASPHHQKHDPNRQKLSSSPNWWTPLFGWSSDPDYVQVQQTSNSHSNDANRSIKSEPGRGTNSSSSSRSKFGVGCFTEEKAKELRRKTRENSTFHDIMYHSAIASRLASDVSWPPREF
ncbi:hypothetical protein ACH5RR_024564 [Cinchona calisaya]|uniref:Ovate family protein n=1 Tax=Cinchona calisaya TaxID=153742 RepID=A0ABD2Z173_9GENT